jgi:hypothetical protein
MILDQSLGFEQIKKGTKLLISNETSQDRPIRLKDAAHQAAMGAIAEIIWRVF